MISFNFEMDEIKVIQEALSYLNIKTQKDEETLSKLRSNLIRSRRTGNALKPSEAELNMLILAIKNMDISSSDYSKDLWIKVKNKIKQPTNMSEALNNKISNESVNEELQLGDKVKYDKEVGYINGQIEGKFIVQIQGSTYLVDPKDLKEYNKKPEPTTNPHMKFDEQTQKVLFEQYVKCGIFQGNIPVKVNNCYVKYSNWAQAKDNDPVNVIMESSHVFMPKMQIRLFENINDFANEDNYIPGVIIDEQTEDVLENILLNAVDYTQAIGDSDSIRIVKTTSTGEQELQTVPKSMVRTLSV